MLDVDLIDRLADLPHIVAIKQSGGDMHRLADLLLRVGERITILSAVDDLLFPSFLLGAHGTLAAIQTIAPRLVVDLWHACQAGNIAQARHLHELILPIWRSVEAPNMPARIKEALRLQGRDGGIARRPLGPVSAAERANISAALERAALLALQPV
jgi:4-hydroxy-tetrahydrodipicolinate synthase